MRNPWLETLMKSTTGKVVGRAVKTSRTLSTCLASGVIPGILSIARTPVDWKP
jgi:hypothetical protein